MTANPCRAPIVFYAGIPLFGAGGAVCANAEDDPSEIRKRFEWGGAGENWLNLLKVLQTNQNNSEEKR